MQKLFDLLIEILLLFFKNCRLKNIIVFESLPIYTDNAKYVFDELINNNVLSKYKVWWITKNNNDNITFSQKNVKVINTGVSNPIKRLIVKIQKLYIISSAKFLISSNEFLPKINTKKQYYLNLAHGAALKDCSNHYNLPDYYDEAISMSDYLAKYDAINFNCDVEKMNVLGYPRNDLLFGRKKDIQSIFKFSNFEKSIYWMPTYRQHYNKKRAFSSIAFPIIYNESIAVEINDCAKDNNLLIIVKPHPAQDMSRIKKLNLSNLVFIDNDFLSKNNIENYELLCSVDAMISDYSSVYYDYLLCDKPIGLCFDDFDEYNKNEGFTVDPNFILAGGEKIYNTQDMCDFIEHIANGEDKLKDKRNEIKNLCHLYKDDKSAKRVADYILNKIV